MTEYVIDLHITGTINVKDDEEHWTDETGQALVNETNDIWIKE